MIKAFIFDFDGLILDTETPDYLTWQSIYKEHGFELPQKEWGTIIGGSALSHFDAAEHLSRLSQGRLDPAPLRARQQLESDALIHASAIMPGVLDYINEAKRLGFKLAIASSSTHAWVDPHAKRLGIFDRFDAVICADDVGVGRTKPNPDLFLSALSQLGVGKEAAIVFEDSPNGVTAANRAGIYVVAVLNPVTSLLAIEGANLILRSLSDMPVGDLLHALQ
ncbi:MAG TPA: HAD-IA family hydrolase [Anaerolineales bacterium]|nr:HAD-IA family hydrolase [Anaerolineales bacterium]